MQKHLLETNPNQSISFTDQDHIETAIQCWTSFNYRWDYQHNGSRHQTGIWHWIRHVFGSRERYHVQTIRRGGHNSWVRIFPALCTCPIGFPALCTWECALEMGVVLGLYMLPYKTLLLDPERPIKVFSLVLICCSYTTFIIPDQIQYVMHMRFDNGVWLLSKHRNNSISFQKWLQILHSSALSVSLDDAKYVLENWLISWMMRQ